MEGKKGTIAEPAKPLSISRAFSFIGEVKDEIGRVSWTSADELKVYVKVVVGATFAFGIGIYMVDLGIQNLLRGLGIIVRAVIG